MPGTDHVAVAFMGLWLVITVEVELFSVRIEQKQKSVNGATIKTNRGLCRK